VPGLQGARASLRSAGCRLVVGAPRPPLACGIHSVAALWRRREQTWGGTGGGRAGGWKLAANSGRDGNTTGRSGAASCRDADRRRGGVAGKRGQAGTPGSRAKIVAAPTLGAVGRAGGAFTARGATGATNASGTASRAARARAVAGAPPTLRPGGAGRGAPVAVAAVSAALREGDAL